MFQWRRFQFFEKQALVEDTSATTTTSPPAPAAAGSSTTTPKSKKAGDLTLFEKFNLTCSSSGRGHLVFGDSDGFIHVVNRDMVDKPFQAFETNVLAVHQLKRTNIIVSIGNDALDNTTVKFWRVSNVDEANEEPTLARARKIFSSKVPFSPVTAFAVLEDLTQLVVGLANGQVLLFEGNLLRDRLPKLVILQRETGVPITGLHFVESASMPVSLFVVTNDEVVTYWTQRDDHTRVLVDSEGGAPAHCSVLDDDGHLVCGREQAVYFCETEMKGICFGFEGDKQRLGWFNSYLYIVNGDRNPQRCSLTVYDLKNKFIAFQSKFDAILDVCSEWGSLYVITSKRRAFRLQEQDLPTKMSVLFGRNLYSIAISLANSQDCDKSYIKEIFQHYGDHLYGKGDYDGAIQQYLETISFVEPSYVIRKFLDAQRIHNLTRYLQALHEKGMANQDHTTLLLNCYTKLKDTNKLEEFIRSDKIEFDVTTAITVLREASYYEYAWYLAEKHHNADMYLRIQLEDVNAYQKGLDYMWTLSFDEAQKYARQYGQKFVDSGGKHMDAFTELLKALCTGYRPRKPTVIDTTHTPAMALAALTSSAGGTGEEKKASSSTTATATTSSSSPKTTTTTTTNAGPLPHGRADDFIHFFIGDAKHLEDFLEYVIHAEPASSPLLYNTLLELYMRGGDRTDPAVADKIMALLKSQQAVYDVDHALVLTKQYAFESGVTYLYEKLRLYNEIVQYHMERNQHSKVIRACRKYGDNDPQLWVQALSYFAAKDEACEQEIVQVLESVEEKRLLPPLMAVKILSQSKNKPLVVIKDYIIKTLQHESALISAHQREIASYQKETQSMREEIKELNTAATPFQDTQCHACRSQLDLPSVHFLCTHSFHERCLGDQDQECPKCSPEYKQVTDMCNMMKASASEHDKFFKQLDDSEDGFATVADYFGRGIFFSHQQQQQQQQQRQLQNKQNDTSMDL